MVGQWPTTAGTTCMVGQPTNLRGLGTPQTLFAQLRSVVFDVLPYLDSQTTSKLNETSSDIFIIGRLILGLVGGPRITSIRCKYNKNGSKMSKGFINTYSFYTS